jgi:hypothetical protein
VTLNFSGNWLKFKSLQPPEIKFGAPIHTWCAKILSIIFIYILSYMIIDFDGYVRLRNLVRKTGIFVFVLHFSIFYGDPEVGTSFSSDNVSTYLGKSFQNQICHPESKKLENEGMGTLYKSFLLFLISEDFHLCYKKIRLCKGWTMVTWTLLKGGLLQLNLDKIQSNKSRNDLYSPYPFIF